MTDIYDIILLGYQIVALFGLMLISYYAGRYYQKLLDLKHGVEK